jgi:multidrug efflux pump subunit AcrA (membrane-fusion protein)
MRWSLPLSALALGLAVCGCSGSSADNDPGVPVETALVERHAINEVVTAEAVLSPIREVALTPKVAAPVKKFYVKLGEKVHPGELLAELENSDLAAAELENKGAYEQAQANYQIARASGLPEELRKAQSDAQAARQNLDAQEKIYSSREELFKQGAIPRKDLDSAQVALTEARGQNDIAQNHLRALEAGGEQKRIQAAGAQLTEARGKYLGAAAQLSYSELRSPIAGVVTYRLAYPGQMPAAGDPVMTVMDLSQIIAKAHIPQQQAATLKIGDAATIIAPDTQEKISARVTVVNAALDPGSSTVEVWVQAANPEQRLKPGSSAQIEMVARSVPDALVVPAAAIVHDSNGANAVMVVGPDSKAHQTSVQLGVKQGDDVQITSGVNAGERVVTQGAYGLPDGAKVQIAPAKPAAETGEIFGPRSSHA